MPGLENYYEYYFIVLILQGYCAIHSIRRGTQSKWIWLIVFLPVVGSIAYIFTEIIKKGHVSSIESGVANIINPGGRISDLEKNFKFSNTFKNRVALGDAYLSKGMIKEATELYEAGLTGIFVDNEYLIKQLIYAYSEVGRYEDIVKIAPRIAKSNDFQRTQAHFFYAIALEKVGKGDQAEKEYKSMNHRFSHYEFRYGYGEFLLRADRKDDALEVFQDIVDESQHLNRREKSLSRVWIGKAEQQLKEIEASSEA